MTGRQQCPACEKHWTPPGPCSNWDAGEECGYVEPDQPPPPPRRVEVEGQTAKVDRDALAVMPPERESTHREGFAAARRALAEAAWRKQNASKLEAVK